MEHQTTCEASSSVTIDQLLAVRQATAEDLIDWQKLASEQALQHLEAGSSYGEGDKLIDLMKWEFEQAYQACQQRSVSVGESQGGSQESFVLRSAEQLDRVNEHFLVTTNTEGELIRGECLLSPQTPEGALTRVVVADAEVVYQQQRYRYLGDGNSGYSWESTTASQAQAIHQRFSVAVTDALIARTTRTEAENTEADQAASRLQARMGYHAMAGARIG